MSALLVRIRHEPALIGGVIAALTAFLTDWLVNGQPVQGAGMAAVSLLVSGVVRSQVSPVVKPAV